MRSRDDILSRINALCLTVDAQRRELWQVTNNPNESERISSIPDYIELPKRIRALESMIGVLHWVLEEDV